MNKRLLVCLLALSVTSVLSACGSGTQNRSELPASVAAPVEMEVVQPSSTASPAAYNELLDPEFGCAGGGSLEYGVVQRPSKN
jgi:ABC-type glycerol-3-phosphate transport system substrate-binding protein